jgi:hypothetical protein
MVMLKQTKTMIAVLMAAGVVVIAGAVYVTATWATGSAAAAPFAGQAGRPAVVAASPATQAVQNTDQETLRAAILDMIQDHMGLSGADAEAFADQMIARMQGVFSDEDFQSMLDSCGRYIDDQGNDQGNDGRTGRPGGMMNWATGPGDGAGPSGTAPQAGTDSGSWTPPCFR